MLSPYFFRADCVPRIELDGPSVGMEGKQVHIHTQAGYHFMNFIFLVPLLPARMSLNCACDSSCTAMEANLPEAGKMVKTQLKMPETQQHFFFKTIR